MGDPECRLFQLSLFIVKPLAKSLEKNVRGKELYKLRIVGICSKMRTGGNIGLSTFGSIEDAHKLSSYPEQDDT